MYDVENVLWNLQRIDQDGNKLFLKGGRVKGCFHPLGAAADGWWRQPDHHRIAICEGWATGASILRADITLTVLVAFNAGNLESVARAVRIARPNTPIVIAADDDWCTTGNPGVAKAHAAAELIGAGVAVPEFPEGRGEKDTDFNDMMRLRGCAAVRDILDGTFSLAPEPCLPPPEDEEGEGGKPAPVITPINFKDLPDEEPPPRKFLVDQWLPMGSSQSLYGPGGVGKSLLAQQIATSSPPAARARRRASTQCPVLGLFAEDDDDELIRRQWRINQTLGLTQSRPRRPAHPGPRRARQLHCNVPHGRTDKDALFEVTVSQGDQEIGAGLSSSTTGRRCSWSTRTTGRRPPLPRTYAPDRARGRTAPPSY